MTHLGFGAGRRAGRPLAAQRSAPRGEGGEGEEEGDEREE